MKLSILIGSGRKIALFTAPLLIPGVIFNILFPNIFFIGGPFPLLKVFSTIVLVSGIIIWGWSVLLVLINVPQKKLITSGPFSFIKHPLYTAVALLIIPSLGFLINTWLGLAIGIVVYIGSRIFSPEEEKTLAKTFGTSWDEYCKKVSFPWL
jgi:protein-S-isoprenylcysteine O-methyltransferase Ste14